MRGAARERQPLVSMKCFVKSVLLDFGKRDLDLRGVFKSGKCGTAAVAVSKPGTEGRAMPAGVCLCGLANGRLSCCFNWHQEDHWELGAPDILREGLKGASAPWNCDSGVKAGKGQGKVQEVKMEREHIQPSLPRIAKV